MTIRLAGRWFNVNALLLTKDPARRRIASLLHLQPTRRRLRQLERGRARRRATQRAHQLRARCQPVHGQLGPSRTRENRRRLRLMGGRRRHGGRQIPTARIHLQAHQLNGSPLAMHPAGHRRSHQVLLRPTGH